MSRQSSVLIRESDVQFGLRRLFESVGAWTYSLSQNRASRQSAGLPDFIVLLPRKLGCVFVEVKAPGGKLRDCQEVFADRCAASGSQYLCASSLEAGHAFLSRLGLIAHPGAG